MCGWCSCRDTSNWHLISCAVVLFVFPEWLRRVLAGVQRFFGSFCGFSIGFNAGGHCYQGGCPCAERVEVRGSKLEVSGGLHTVASKPEAAIGSGGWQGALRQVRLSASGGRPVKPDFPFDGRAAITVTSLIMSCELQCPFIL